MVAAVGDDEGGDAEGDGKFPAGCAGAAEDERVGGPEHGVEVEHEVCGIDDGANVAGAVEFEAGAGAVEDGGVPDPVHVLVDEAGGCGLCRVEAFEGGEVEEAEGKAAAAEANGAGEEAFEKAGEDDCAADLVAVHECREHDVGAGLLGFDRGEAEEAGIAGAPGGEVGGREVDGEAGDGRRFWAERHAGEWGPAMGHHRRSVSCGQ